MSRAVTFTTTPSIYSALNFRYQQPYERVLTISTNAEEIRLPRLNFEDLNTEYTMTFELPERVVYGLLRYMRQRYFRDIVRNCHEFAAYMGGMPIHNYTGAGLALGRRVQALREPVTTPEPYDIVSVAHPDHHYKAFGGVCVSHSMVVLDTEHTLQLAGLGGPPAIASAEHMLEEYRHMASNSNAAHWLDGVPKPSNIAIYRTGLRADMLLTQI